MNEFFDAMAAFGPPADPLDDPQHLPHSGVGRLRAARTMLHAGDAAGAAQAAADARTMGLPADIVPHAHLLHGAALLLTGETDAAIVVLRDGWRDHPDFSALPAVLGAAQFVAGDATRAAHSMYAALVTDDPDRTLALYRVVLTRCHDLLRR